MSFVDLLQPIIVSAASTFVAYAASFAAKKWQIEVDEKARKAVVEAIVHGTNWAISRGADPKNKAFLVEQSVEYVEQNLPDTVKKLKADKRSLARLAESLLHSRTR